jgi:hypothetical protein
MTVITDTPPYGLSPRQFLYHMRRVRSAYTCLLGPTEDLAHCIQIAAELTKDAPDGAYDYKAPSSEPTERETSAAMSAIQMLKDTMIDPPLTLPKRRALPTGLVF